jgi:hypothetical protein
MEFRWYRMTTEPSASNSWISLLPDPAAAVDPAVVAVAAVAAVVAATAVAEDPVETRAIPPSSGLLFQSRTCR